MQLYDIRSLCPHENASSEATTLGGAGRQWTKDETLVAAVDRINREFGKGAAQLGEERRFRSLGRRLFTTPSQEGVDAPGGDFHILANCSGCIKKARPRFSACLSAFRQPVSLGPGEAGFLRFGSLFHLLGILPATHRLLRSRFPGNWSRPAVEKEDIERPEPGSLPSRISFVEQMGGTAGYYVRFQSVPEEKGGPVQKYVPILQFDSQEEALQAAIDYRNQKAEELGVPIESERSPHSEASKEKMSDFHNRTGLRGLGFTFEWENGTAYPQLRALWSEEDGQKKRARAMTSRGICAAVEELAPYLKEHLHPEKSEEELIRRGAEGAARLLLRIAADLEEGSRKRERIEELFGRWARGYQRDRALLQRLSNEDGGDPAGLLDALDLAWGGA